MADANAFDDNTERGMFFERNPTTNSLSFAPYEAIKRLMSGGLDPGDLMQASSLGLGGQAAMAAGRLRGSVGRPSGPPPDIWSKANLAKGADRALYGKTGNAETYAYMLNVNRVLRDRGLPPRDAPVFPAWLRQSTAVACGIGAGNCRRLRPQRRTNASKLEQPWR